MENTTKNWIARRAEELFTHEMTNIGEDKPYFLSVSKFCEGQYKVGFVHEYDLKQIYQILSTEDMKEAGEFLIGLSEELDKLAAQKFNPHKYADVIKAWADGKPIQVRIDNTKDYWIDYDAEGLKNSNISMLFYPFEVPRFDQFEWRIKPENDQSKERIM